MSNVWELETRDQQFVSGHLNTIIEQAVCFKKTRARNYLKTLWPECNWRTIKERLLTEGSVWYVFYIDGVNQHSVNLSK